MFIHYMYVDIFSPLTKVIRIIFEHVTMHYQTQETWRDHNATRYQTFSLSLAWFGLFAACYHNINSLPQASQYILSICNALPSNLYEKCILIFFTKIDDNS